MQSENLILLFVVLTWFFLSGSFGVTWKSISSVSNKSLIIIDVKKPLVLLIRLSAKIRADAPSSIPKKTFLCLRIFRNNLNFSTFWRLLPVRLGWFQFSIPSCRLMVSSRKTTISEKSIVFDIFDIDKAFILRLSIWVMRFLKCLHLKLLVRYQL